ncbi:hypothetical protein [Paenibacillus flagellatus]|uniref:Uncharacterized protein n=1 Tax=Paenibacillus flagellatus TaxID=2211139 RepID=A0A2V5KCL3_9BACL|nr:hypothetical protein [Paenibacillus flagellatus]PYI57359.1 hypothetical protein DLM86_02670 [Paenibacillus flagellatus]
MAWSELRRIPNAYNDEIRQIDETMISLLVERRTKTGGKRFFPEPDVLEQWSERFGLDAAQLGLLLHLWNEGARPAVPSDKGALLGVLPLMKKTCADGCEYVLTHAMQFEHVSVVELDIAIDRTGTDAERLHLKPQLQLVVLGDREYSVSRQGARGGGGTAHLTFRVSPPLPDPIGDVRFTLVPMAMQLHSEPKELVLDKQVDFG